MTREELLSITIEKTSDEKYQEIKNTLGELEKRGFEVSLLEPEKKGFLMSADMLPA